MVKQADQKKARKAGGSATIKARGLGRGGEVSPGDPARFCAIDGPNEGDLSLDALLDKYKGNAWAQAVIRACIDKGRAGEGAEPFFWHRLRNGVNHPIRYVDLGEDRFGKIWLPIADGRHRKAGVILVNVERASTADPEPIELPGWAIKLPKGDGNAEKAAEIVRRIKNDANVYNRMKPSHLAARASEWSVLGNSHHVIAQKLALGLDPERAESAEIDAMLRQRIKDLEGSVGKIGDSLIAALARVTELEAMLTAPPVGSVAGLLRRVESIGVGDAVANVGVQRALDVIRSTLAAPTDAVGKVVAEVPVCATRLATWKALGPYDRERWLPPTQRVSCERDKGGCGALPGWPCKPVAIAACDAAKGGDRG